MSLGWIDFSKEERNKVLNVIHLLDEPGAVDELGIGSVRDSFADFFSRHIYSSNAGIVFSNSSVCSSGSR